MEYGTNKPLSEKEILLVSQSGFNPGASIFTTEKALYSDVNGKLYYEFDAEDKKYYSLGVVFLFLFLCLQFSLPLELNVHFNTCK